ncbi:MAG: hypothetical protein O3C04_03100 [Crenarchaeota archaeon]|nr:hypothetical protein [Thermoproteota archaeon]MDA1124616.1 hypothetical protein [Thermoproteota archaeon]
MPKTIPLVREQDKPSVKRILGQNKDVNVNFLTVGFWTSSILAVVLAVPSLVVFVYFYTVLDNLLIGALLALGTHFALLSVSDRISHFLTNLIDDKKKKPDIHGFMSSDFFTFETDDENVMILSINENGKEKKEVHSYMLEHQVFHVTLNKYSKKTPKLTY